MKKLNEYIAENVVVNESVKDEWGILPELRGGVLTREVVEDRINLGDGMEVDELVLPEGVTRIDKRAFQSSDKSFATQNFIKRLVLPKSLDYIDDEAFSGMYYLEEVVFQRGARLRGMGRSVFSKCPNLVRVELPESIEKITRTIFDNCESLETVIAPGVTSLESFAFYGLSNLKEVTFSQKRPVITAEVGFKKMMMMDMQMDPKKLLKGGPKDNIFSGCENLEEINGIMTGNFTFSTFQDCKKLKEIHWTGDGVMTPSAVVGCNADVKVFIHPTSKMSEEDIDTAVECVEIAFGVANDSSAYVPEIEVVE